jgi:hypothetical protein
MTTVGDTDDDVQEREMSLKKEDTAFFQVSAAARERRLYKFQHDRTVWLDAH